MAEGESETVYTNAIHARAFDICRGFLPAGTSTNLAWTTTLRQFADRITIMRHHPLAEVREIADKLEDALIEVYENSFAKKRYEETENYLSGVVKENYYYHDANSPAMELVHDGVNHAGLKPYTEVLSTRPPKTELPKWIGSYGVASFAWNLDFGSFRDVQRHRAVTQRMPLLTSEIGFHDWYLDELTPDLKIKAVDFIESQRKLVLNLTDNQYDRQYYFPMGYKISNYLTGDLAALTYLVELRASNKVHPTLAFQAEAMAKLLLAKYGNLGLKIHIGEVTGRFDISRGKDTITKLD
jgi:hypothetical protein